MNKLRTSSVDDCPICRLSIGVDTRFLQQSWCRPATFSIGVDLDEGERRQVGLGSSALIPTWQPRG
jgi:hypothetical protein